MVVLQSIKLFSLKTFLLKRFLCVLHMAIFKYKKYLAINIDFVNILKNFSIS